jgi:hypothetical protein
MSQNLSFEEKQVFVPLGAEIHVSETPLVIVHPFYYGDVDDTLDYYNIFSNNSDQILRSLHENYLENMKKFLSSFQGNIYLYESDLKFDTTRKVLLDTRRSLDGVYFFKTQYYSSRSVNDSMRLKDLDYLAGIGSKFIFAGGRVVKYLLRPRMDGCLGGLVEELNRLEVNGNFVEGCCFT